MEHVKFGKQIGALLVCEVEGWWPVSPAGLQFPSSREHSRYFKGMFGAELWPGERRARRQGDQLANEGRGWTQRGGVRAADVQRPGPLTQGLRGSPGGDLWAWGAESAAGGPGT